MVKSYDKNVLSTIQYFTFFDYPPNFEEIHTFYPQKVGRKALQDSLNHLEKNKKIEAKKDHLSTKRYTPRGYTQAHRQYAKRVVTSTKKVDGIGLFLLLASKLPQIKLIGLSGSVTMSNAEPTDDVDLFVITSQNRLWTGRFLSIVLASLLGKRRRREEEHVNNKICLNMFFDSSGLQIPQKKRTIYVAHEVLQMKPRVDKENTYSRFLEANSWVFDIFPNARKKQLRKQRRGAKKTLVGDLFEAILKKIQLNLINRHKTTELISDKQLWFFPDDFEKKIKV